MLVQVPKSGLMGFGNCAHEEDKHLRVQFLWHRRPHEATLADQVCSSSLQYPFDIATCYSAVALPSYNTI